MAISKAERKRNNVARRRLREASKRDRMMGKGATLVGAYGGQKFFAGMTTPGTAAFPIQYSVGLLATLIDIAKPPTGASSARLLDLMQGVGLGQVAVMGYQSATPLFAAK